MKFLKINDCYVLLISVSMTENLQWANHTKLDKSSLLPKSRVVKIK